MEVVGFYEITSLPRGAKSDGRMVFYGHTEVLPTSPGGFLGGAEFETTPAVL